MRILAPHRHYALLLLLPLLLGLSVTSHLGEDASVASEEGGLLDVFFAAPDTLVPGTQASFRVTLARSESLMKSRPVAGGRVRVVLVTETGDPVTLFEGTTGREGVVQARFEVPRLAQGAFTLRIEAVSGDETQTLERKVRLKRAVKILLVSDKPLYQPGQTIHLRALALETQTLKPVGNEAVLFEIEDGKGNKVFKRKGQTDAFGVAVVDFTLADEVNMGPYGIRALLGNDVEVKKTVTVKSYVLPKFKIAVTTEKSWFLPKDTLEGEIQVDYFFGKPVAGGEVTIKASTFDVAFKQFQETTATLDENGHASFSIALPDHFVGQPLEQGNALVKVDVAVKDLAQHVEKSTRTWPVAAHPLKVGIIPESGKLVPGVENKVFVVVGYPDGSPAIAEVTARINPSKKGPAFHISTEAGGIGSFTFVPNKVGMARGAWVQAPVGLGGLGRGRGGRTQEWVLPVTLEVKDAQGGRVTLERTLKSEQARGAVLLRTNKAIYRAGEDVTLDCLAPFPSGTVYLDVIKGGQVVLTTMAEITKGRATHVLPLAPDVFGSLEIHAYKLLSNGELARDTRVVYVHPPSDLSVTVTPDKSTYRPGEAARIDFQVTDPSGAPARAALGVVIVDESVYALQDMQPGLEKVYYTLEKELQRPMVELHAIPGSLSDLIGARHLEERKQRAAGVLLASAQPVTSFGMVSNPQAERIQKLGNNVQAVYWALQRRVNSGKPFATHDAESGRWSWNENILEQLEKENHIQGGQLIDPWKHRLTMEGLMSMDEGFEVAAWVKAREAQLTAQLFNALTHYMLTHDAARYDPGTGEYAHIPGVLKALQKKNRLNRSAMVDLHGERYTLAKLAAEDEAFSPENLARMADAQRKRKIFDALKARAGSGLWSDLVTWSETRDTWVYARDALTQLVRAHALQEETIRDTRGARFTLAALEKEWKGFAPDNMIRVGLYANVRAVASALHNWGQRNRKVVQDEKSQSWIFPEDVFSRLGKNDGFQARFLRDPWGEDMRLVRLDKPPSWRLYSHEMRCYVLESAGADGEFGTSDDIRSDQLRRRYSHYPWPGGIHWHRGHSQVLLGGGRGGRWLDFARRGGRDALDAAAMEGAPEDQKAGAPGAARRELKKEGHSGSRPQVRVRDYFPETLLWSPSIITDAQGRARIDLDMADSITTWRLTASASAASGGLGSATAELRVFQDFFVDIDFPVSLTQNDEVSVPVAVYNYLDKPQTVELVVERKGETWFELLDETTKKVELDAGEVDVVHFRLRAQKIGHHRLTVMAYGSSLNDAVRRQVAVVPDGQRMETVRNGKLEPGVTFDLNIPQDAVEDASKILVKVYPGVFSQIMDGLDGLLHLPGG